MNQTFSESNINEVDLSILDNNSTNNYLDFEDKQPDIPQSIDDQRQPEPEPEPEPPTIEDLKELTDMRVTINAYIEHFSDELKAFIPTDIYILSLDELIDLKLQFDDVLNCVSPIRYVKNVSDQVLPIYENIMTNKAGLQIQGLAKLLSENKEYDKTLKHCALQYFATTHIRPENRLMMMIMMTTVNLHNINKSNLLQDINKLNIDTINDQYRGEL